MIDSCEEPFQLQQTKTQENLENSKQSLFRESQRLCDQKKFKKGRKGERHFFYNSLISRKCRWQLISFFILAPKADLGNWQLEAESKNWKEEGTEEHVLTDLMEVGLREPIFFFTSNSGQTADMVHMNEQI